jgi:putative folate metabolism gamma-glutamate ligase
MKVTPIKTRPIVSGDSLFSILDEVLSVVKEKNVLAISSKIVGICEGRVVKSESVDQKDALARRESAYYLPREFNQYGFMITINRGVLVASAGVDESNGNGYYVLWPEDPQKSVNDIRAYLQEKFQLQNVGVVMTDSKLTPLRWGVTGVAIAHSGFAALKNYIGTPDIFGRLLHAEKSNIADALATAAVVEMGEGNEQQPLALIDELSFVDFQDRNPTSEELRALKIDLDDDVYASLLTRVPWERGGGR